MKYLFIAVFLFCMGCAVDGPFDRGKKDNDLGSSNGSGKVIEPDVPGEAPIDIEDPVDIDDPPPIAPAEFYRINIEPLIEADCMGCHASKIQNYQDGRERITPGDPENSVFYTKGIGSGHPGIWQEDGEAAVKVREWIMREVQ